MSPEMIVRAWKDPEYRATLAAELPDNPAGSADVPTEELAGEAYITSPLPQCSIGSACTLVGACG